MTAPIRPDGRWARILAALADGPMPLGEVVRAARDPAWARDTDRAKVFGALRRLAALGLTDRDQLGWFLTRDGRQAAEDLARRREA